MAIQLRIDDPELLAAYNSPLATRADRALILALYNTQQLEKIMATLAQLQAAVAAEKTVVDSAVVLLAGLVERLKSLEPNQAAIDQLAADVEAQTKELADAVAAVPAA
jgi:uncharacterized coiled-coil protein SlyX